MKVLISYPPLKSDKGCPTLGQNRQFQYFKEPTYIYPVVPAQGATALKQAGHTVIWNDCLAENIDYPGFLKLINTERPEVIAFETKTPVIKQIWKIVNEVKAPLSEYNPFIVLFGDHVTALPEESLENSRADFILTGGDYDFLLLNLCSVISQGFLAEKLEPGIFFREGLQIKNTGNFELHHNLDSAPFIDRELTKWKNYAYKNGNYKRVPGTYIMSARDCWWGECSFCSWPALYPKFRSRNHENVLEEIGLLIKNYQVREIMDDSGCFPAGEWLRDFCQGMIKQEFNNKIYFDCNMRFGALSEEEFKLMKRANFRLLLFGLESANQNTLDRINKNLKAERIIEDCKLARKAGLFPHLTIMFGYPWESYCDAQKTLELGCWLLKKGYAYTMQATIVIPYPGTPLFEECKNNGWLKSLNWDDYDMKAQAMHSSITEDELKDLVQEMYRISLNPEFFLRKIFSIRDFADVLYYLRAAKKVAGHLFDFRLKEL